MWNSININISKKYQIPHMYTQTNRHMDKHWSQVWLRTVPVFIFLAYEGNHRVTCFLSVRIPQNNLLQRLFTDVYCTTQLPGNQPVRRRTSWQLISKNTRANKTPAVTSIRYLDIKSFISNCMKDRLLVAFIGNHCLAVCSGLVKCGGTKV